MARSNYIYVVLKDEIPVAGFTVKHELKTWFDRNKTEKMKIWRIRDNNLYFDNEPKEIRSEIE
jgi:hypothetical protein